MLVSSKSVGRAMFCDVAERSSILLNKQIANIRPTTLDRLARACETGLNGNGSIPKKATIFFSFICVCMAPTILGTGSYLFGSLDDRIHLDPSPIRFCVTQ